jgi:hypothetical protein
MHHLGDDERTVRLDAADDGIPSIGLRSASQAGLMAVALQERVIRANAFGADRPEAAPRETLVVAGHHLGRPAILGRRDASPLQRKGGASPYGHLWRPARKPR